jgi:hypothetical protein
MLKYHLNDEPRTCKTSWKEVSLAEYIQLQSMEDREAICLLTGIKPQEYEGVFMQGISTQEIVLQNAAVELMATEPTGPKLEGLPHSLGADTIGKLELCKMYLRQYEEQPEQAYPFLYAIYAWPEQYDLALSLSGAGFPAPVLALAGKLPVTQVIGTVAHIVAEINRIGERYAVVLDKEPTGEQMAANIARFEKYGFWATVATHCAGDMTKISQILNMQADVFYMTMCVEVEKAEYQEKLNEVTSKKK